MVTKTVEMLVARLAVWLVAHLVSVKVEKMVCEMVAKSVGNLGDYWEKHLVD